MKIKSKKSTVILIIIFCVVLNSCNMPFIAPLPTPSPMPDTLNQYSIIQYESSDKTLQNPFRGFYHHTETHSVDYYFLDSQQLEEYRQNNITTILRVYYLENFLSTPISEEYLINIKSDMDVIRAEGFNVILRFAYTSNTTLPYGDAPKEIIVEHIAQLKPIFQEYSDVIKIVQAGFIGAWGEWYYTDYFVEDPAIPSRITSVDYENRADVLFTLLKAAPQSTFVLLRTPNYKQQIFPDQYLDANSAFSKTEVSRTGFHNDCFLASPDDYGTFQNDEDRRYMANETLFTPMGGETCNPNPPRSSCLIALEELALFHWSFMNIDYHAEVLDSWANEGCFSEIENNLGYRFVLQRAAFSDQVVQGQNLRAEIELKNTGWAGPFFRADIEFVIRNKESQEEYSFIVSDDARDWLPSDTTYTISHAVCVPKSVPPGSYDLFLRLSPSDAEDKPLYAIQFANEIAWEENKGLNNLAHSFEVLAAGDNQADCTEN